MKDEQCDLICLTLPRAEALRGRRLSLEEAQFAAATARAFRVLLPQKRGTETNAQDLGQNQLDQCSKGDAIRTR
jgi:hypothetical protein